MTNRDRFQGMLNDLFAPESRDFEKSGFSSYQGSLPKVNIREGAKEFVLELAVPGMEKSDFLIKLEENILTVSSEKDDNASNEERKYSKKEFSFQPFKKVFTLPESADAEKVTANYPNGVLAIHIPKKEEALPQPPKSIKVG